MLTGVLAGGGSNFGREKDHDQSIFIGGPCRAIVAKEACSCAFFSPETEGTVEESRHKPLEADGHFGQAATQFTDDPVNHAAADKCFSDDDILPPLRAGREEIPDSYCQGMIGVHQSSGWTNNPVPVGIGIVGEC